MSLLLESGEKIHVIHRQLFEGDTRRHFVGTIEGCEEGVARATGFLFAMDTNLNQFIKRDTPRTRIISLSCGSVIVNVLPKDVQIDKITYNYHAGGDTIVTDGGNWHLDISHL